LLHLPQTGNVLLTIDAVPLQRLFTLERKASPIDDDEEQLRESTRRLIDIAVREHVNLIVFGHDGTQWQTLKKAPEFYA
jgi:N-acyl homoserine lactone hydrolase